MSSLKELRNRIASVQGNTKGHQGHATGCRRQAQQGAPVGYERSCCRDYEPDELEILSDLLSRNAGKLIEIVSGAQALK